jgi:hypothetical protein
MAVTRIKNNQVTDSSAGNTQVGINAGTKLQDFSITAGKIANNLTYGSNLTVTGNLTVQGNSTAIDTTITTIEDPIIVLASTQTSGAPAVDIGYLGFRGNQSNIAFVWDESAGQFVTAFTSTGESNTTITITSYANLQIGNLSLTGNILNSSLNVTGNIIGGNLLTPGLISATGTITSAANITGGNILTGGLITATGNITGGNILTSGSGGAISGTGNITGGNLLTGGLISATSSITSAANITGGNILTAGIVSAGGNVIADNVLTDNVISSGAITITTASNGAINLQPNGTGNVVLGGNTYINGISLTPAQDNDAASKYYVDTLVSTSISYHEAVFAATTGNLDAATGGTVTYNQPNGAANGIGATLTTTGSFNLIDTANVQSANTRILVKDQANAVQNGVYVWSNSTVITRSSDTNTAGLGNVDALGLNDYFYTTSGNVNKGTAFIVDAPSGLITFGTSNIQFAIFSQTQVYSANTSAGLSLIGTVFSAKVDDNTTAFDGGGNISVKAGANLTTPNIGAATGTSLSVTANVTGGNITTAGLITVTGNITGGNILSGGLGSFTGNVTAANFIGNIDAGGANTQIQFNDSDVLSGSAGFTFDKVGNVVTANGNVNSANLILTSGIIDGPAAGRITINGSDIDTDFAVDGDTLANVFYVDAGTGTASFGASTQVTNAIVNFATTTSIKAPVGNTAQRPGTGVTGMLRFNTTSNALEVYDNSAWTSVGVPVFTVIDDEQFAGDGSTVAFTLGSTQTTNSCIVSINGVVQIPTLAYAVAGTDPTCVLTFTEAPAAGDVIDVRQITTTTSVTSISNSAGNAVIATAATAQINITGNLVPTSNITFDLGTTSLRWRDGYFAGNSLYLGNTVIKNTSGNSIGFFGPDGTTPATIDAASVDTTTIANGTSNVKVVSSGGNVTVGVAGNSNVAIFGPTGLGLGTGNLGVGNINNFNANGVGNIGSAGGFFNTVFAKATSAQYADLAEKYTADADYAPGTVVMFGGTAEVTLCVNEACPRVAGVISTNPSYRMNDGLQSEHTAMVALTGRVPTRVTGTVRKGDIMVSAGNGVARAEALPRVGTVIGKALADSEGDAVIEVVVGRV